MRYRAPQRTAVLIKLLGKHLLQVKIATLDFHWRTIFVVYIHLEISEYKTGASFTKWLGWRKMRQLERNRGVVKRQQEYLADRRLKASTKDGGSVISVSAGGQNCRAKSARQTFQSQNFRANILRAKILKPNILEPKDGDSAGAGPFSHAAALLTCPGTD